MHPLARVTSLSFFQFKAVCFFFPLTTLLPKLPNLIHASPPLPLKAPLGSVRASLEKVWYFNHVRHLAQSSSFLLFLSQFLLNQRARTFGANYRSLAGVDLVSSIFHVLPVLLSARWGRWELMDPWAAWDLLVVARKGAYAWQAWNFVGVKQEEEENE